MPDRPLLDPPAPDSPAFDSPALDPDAFERALDRAALLAAARHHPFARFASGRSARLTGLADGGAVLMVGETDIARIGYGLGPTECLDALLTAARSTGLLDGVSWVNLPRQDRGSLPAGYELNEEWDFRWTTRPIAEVPGEDRVAPVDDADAINALLDVAFPESMLRPGHPMAHGWYGIWSGGTLVACAGDRSTRSPDLAAEPVGVIGGVAVHPEHRGRGYGAAVTAALARRLRERYGLVTLGVIAGNVVATRLYERLGFTGVVELTSIRRTPGSHGRAPS